MSGTGAEALERLGEIDQAHVVRCARVLLRRPLLRAGGPDGELLPLVYRYRVTLGELFSGVLGYRLVTERRFARLYKPGPGADPTRGEPSLTPRGYAYVALCLAALTGIGRQTLLSRLVADVRAAGVQAGIAVSEEAADLRALAAALRHLVSLGVLTETEGTVSGVAGETVAEALLTIDNTLLGHVLSAPLGLAGTPAEFVAAAAHTGSRGVAQAVRRRLVEQPVTHYADLPEDAAAWLRRRARAESRLLERCFGLQTETRREGIAVTDPEDYLTDLPFPGQSALKRLALLALPRLLAEAEPDDAGRVTVPGDRFAEICAELVEEYPAAWSKDVVGNLARLVADLVTLLGALGLAYSTVDGSVCVNPSAHRWAPVPDAAPRPGESAPEPEPVVPGWSLFDDEGGEP